MAAVEEVRLTVPATPEFLRLARVTVAGLGGRLGFSYDEIEDLRLAIDELCFGSDWLHGPGWHGRDHLLLDGGHLTVEGRGRFRDDITPTNLSNLSQIILSALVDEH